MLCPNCGYNNSPNNRFCVRCGIDLSAPASTAPPAAPPGPAPGQPSDAPVAPPGPATPATPNPWGAPPPPPPPPTPPPNPPPNPYVSAPPPGSPPAAPNPFAPPPPPPPPGYGAYSSGPGPGPYGQYVPYPAAGFHPPSTNGLAIAALILGIVGWLPCGIGSVLAVILGFIARSQIRATQGRQGGDGLALAGIILGFIGIGLVVVFFVATAISGPSNSS